MTARIDYLLVCCCRLRLAFQADIGQLRFGREVIFAGSKNKQVWTDRMTTVFKLV